MTSSRFPDIMTAVDASTATIRIRAAEPEEAGVLTDIAPEAKRSWRYPERWIATWRESLTLTGEVIARQPTVVAERDGVVSGFYSIRSTGDRWSLEHLWVRPRSMGQGVGRALFADATARVRRHGGRILWIESDPNAEGFYLAMGARRVGEIASDPDGNGRVLPCLEVDVIVDVPDPRGEP